MTKALLLFSGGLDSILVAKILMEQKIKVVPVCFKSLFFGCSLAQKTIKDLGLKLKIVDISKKHLDIIKNPKRSVGKGMNPCIDCHLFMIKTAKEIMIRDGYDFLATGEVLNERPFSQNRNVFTLVEKELDLEGLILRPLSAKLLPITIPEKKGLVKRSKLFDVSGKSRKTQIALTKKFKIKDFPSPAGGCILTDINYAKKLKYLFNKIPDCDSSDCLILKNGRIVWDKKIMLVIGREERDNRQILKLKKPNDIVLEPDNFAGPTVLIRGFGKEIKKAMIDKAVELLLSYSKKIPQEIIIKTSLKK
ncbi:MAG: tRNA 4-thiouridine(8) synthase ThiI [Patescibacteria group bacterium]|nr:tRNA 4-thiouridine(8) synthase ThiI [Patescibacteria group bacterium]MBU1877293.1 tRNA 4-thiouridine(8) synthase ThiI [Patescibacteria group bacterium]